MPSLDEAYGSRNGLSRPRSVLGGALLLAVGALAVFVAVGLVWVGGDSTTAKLYAGLAAGAGIPAMLLGVVVVLPASTVHRAGVLAGTVLAATGLYLFEYAYPSRWTRTADPLAFETLLVYGVGCAMAVWFVFAAIASIRLRNNPQGTVSLEVIRQGETRTVHLSREQYREIVSDGGDPTKYIDGLGEDDR
ncbi:MAG: DUF7139 domain-containing protein [Natrialbaceae archaeon]